MGHLKILLILLALDLSCGYPLQSKLEYLIKKLVRRDTDYAVWSVDKYPNPMTDLEACNRRGPSRICDPDKVLSEDEANNLDLILSRIKNETSCICKECVAPNSGISVGVAVMRNMFHQYHDDLSIRAEDFARGLLTKWHYGTCDDSIIIFLATENQQSYIVTGEAVKKTLDQDTLDNIFDAVKGHFSTKSYYQGLESLVQSLYDKIRMVMRSPVQDENEETNSGSVGLTVGLVVGFLALAVLFAAGIIFVRKRQQTDGDKLKSDVKKNSAKREMPKSNIVKVPMVFPDAVYQPCSIEDPAGNYRRGSDEEINLEERKVNQADSNTPLREPVDVHNGRMRQELSRVDEEDSKDMLEEIDVDDLDEKIIFAQTHPSKPPRKNDFA